MNPLSFHEDAAGRRWLAARVMRGPLVALKFGSPVLTIATLALIVRQADLAAQPLLVLYAFAFPFAVPFLLAAIYPFVRWMPQEWTIDADGIRGRGRRSGRWTWRELDQWRRHPAEGPPGQVRVVLRRAPAYRHCQASMMVPAAERAAVEAWFRAAAPPAREGPA